MSGYIDGTLSGETCGCFDFNCSETGVHLHMCDAEAGGVLHAADDSDYRDRPESWRIGTAIRLWPVDTAGGVPAMPPSRRSL